MKLPEQFKLFAAEALKGGSPLYHLVALGTAEDAELLALAEKRLPGQPAPNLLFAAVHEALLEGADDPLKDYYPSCGGLKPAGEGDVMVAFRDFALARAPRIAAMVARCVTNTNEVARSSLVYPAYDMIARETAAPLQILEIGPSAGLNLNWHRYGYRYTDETGRVVLEREPNRALVLSTMLKGPGRPAFQPRLPEVACARGLELNPVAIAEPSEQMWQKALIWPERLDRFARQAAALEIAKRHPPEIIAGDAARDLPSVLAGLDLKLPVVVVHTAVTYQFSKPMLAAFEAALGNAGRVMLLYEVGVEWTGETHELQLVEHGPEARRLTLARTDPHGTWLEWL
jgi:hypothetical protein